jgi:hypothetical protein
VLGDVMATVAQERWFDTTAPHHRTIYLSQGASLWMVLGRHGARPVFVKFSPLVSLEAEAARCRAASERYPDHAPRFLGHARRGTMDVLAADAVEFRAVTAEMTLGGRDAQAVRDGLHGYFSRMAQPGRPDVPHPRRPWRDDLDDWLRTLPAGHPAHRCRVRLTEMDAMELPPRAQHGDFVLNNLGLGEEGRLVVFDWEDFGATDLLGLDLFTLEFSFMAGTGRPFPPSGPSSTLASLDVPSWCSLIGLDEATYRHLAPAHGLVFRYLKRNYGPEIQQRLDGLLETIAP